MLELGSGLEYFETGSPLFRILVIEKGSEGLFTTFSSFSSLLVETKLVLRFAEELIVLSLIGIKLLLLTDDTFDGIGESGAEPV